MSAGTLSNFRNGVMDRVISRKRIVQSPVAWVIFSIGLAPSPTPQVLMSLGVAPKNLHSSQARGVRQARKMAALIQRIIKASSWLLVLGSYPSIAVRHTAPLISKNLEQSIYYFSSTFHNILSPPTH